MFEANPNAVPPELKTMWPGGPKRLWSPVRRSSWVPLDSGGYGGQYVCDGCLAPCEGLYRAIHNLHTRDQWLCSACRSPKKAKRGKKACQMVLVTGPEAQVVMP